MWMPGGSRECSAGCWHGRHPALGAHGVHPRSIHRQSARTSAQRPPQRRLPRSHPSRSHPPSIPIPILNTIPSIHPRPEALRAPRLIQPRHRPHHAHARACAACAACSVPCLPTPALPALARTCRREGENTSVAAMLESSNPNGGLCRKTRFGAEDGGKLGGRARARMGVGGCSACAGRCPLCTCALPARARAAVAAGRAPLGLGAAADPQRARVPMGLRQHPVHQLAGHRRRVGDVRSGHPRDQGKHSTSAREEKGRE